MSLKPKRVTIESNAKFFELDRGMSSGSTISMEYDIPEDLEGNDLKLEVYKRKEILDLTLLAMEVARGGISNQSYAERKEIIRNNYDKILKREE